MSKLISVIWGHVPVNEMILKSSPSQGKRTSEQVFGIELEIERTNGTRATDAFMVKEDGSLRDAGLEFVSYPMRHDNLVFALHEFFARNNHLNHENYSERTSVHIHANVQDMTLPQVGNLVLLYQTFEELLFKFVGADRAKNIFCVPLSECATSYRTAVDLQTDDHRVVSRWSKYTAMNLLPVRDIGTVEFRHMHGTNDMVKLEAWINLLNCLMTAAKSYTFLEIYTRINELNTSSQFKQFGGWVFGKHIQHLDCPDYDMMLERGVLNAKWACLGIEKLNNKKKELPTTKLLNPAREILQADWNAPDQWFVREEVRQALAELPRPAPARQV